MKVGVILNGKKDDDSWGESHYIGLEECKKELGIKVSPLAKIVLYGYAEG